MNHLLEALTSFLVNPYITCSALILVGIAKLVISRFIVKFWYNKPQLRAPLFLLLIFLFGTLLDDATYIGSVVLRRILEIQGDIPLFTLYCRISLSLFITAHQALVLFFEYLLTQRIKCTFLHIFSLLCNLLFTSFFLYEAGAYYGIPVVTSSSEYLLEHNVISASYCYVFVLYLGLFIFLIRKLRTRTLPKILAVQAQSCLLYLFPFSLLLFGDGWYTIFSAAHIPFPLGQYSWATLGALCSAILLITLSKKMLGLRLLNLHSDVTSKVPFNFLTNFKDILEQVRYASAVNELGHITQTFFHTAFGIRLSFTRLFIKDAAITSPEAIGAALKIDQFLKEDELLRAALARDKIFIRDSVEFSYFYEASDLNRKILAFLDLIHADLFVPIYEQSRIVAYIMVERDARPDKLYTNKERDEMLVFTSYISNVISALQQSSMEALHVQKKQLTEELYHKHQEINQYKELIRSFMRTSHERKIGIISYKNRTFSYANEAAHDLVGFDLNKLSGHPLTKVCTTVAQRVEQYKTAQIAYGKDTRGTKLVISGIPNADTTSSILLLYYPEISDLLKPHAGYLKDPSCWDYVLYLETTQSGRLINELIPGTSEALLSFKIGLLSAALTRKAVLLSLPEEDLLSAVTLLHSISLRRNLYTLKLTQHEQHDEISTQLFGINDLLGGSQSESLLTKLDESGTLFIQNLELLSLTSQEALAQYIRMGYFYKVKSDQKIMSSARIICSTSKDLSVLVNEGIFSRELFEQLQATTISLPSLTDLAHEDITLLAQGYADQLITTDTFKDLLSITPKETSQLIKECPLSLQELKERIQELLLEKSRSHNITDIEKIDPVNSITDPVIAQAVRLGKKALRDPHIMAQLWYTFKNQSKIAHLLGVNRSSVNRRCRELNLRSN